MKWSSYRLFDQQTVASRLFKNFHQRLHIQYLVKQNVYLATKDWASTYHMLNMTDHHTLISHTIRSFPRLDRLKHRTSTKHWNNSCLRVRSNESMEMDWNRQAKIGNHPANWWENIQRKVATMKYGLAVSSILLSINWSTTSKVSFFSTLKLARSWTSKKSHGR